jgi:nucleotide-binding universal stress UspA family protein
MQAAETLALRENASIEAVHVFFGPWNRLHYRAPTIEVSPEYQQEYRRALEQRLREFVEQCVGAQCQVPITPRLISDYSSTGYGLIRYLDESHSDLVVVGTHGRRGLQRLILGSTAERVLHEACCGVMVVKPAGFDAHT